MSNTLQGQGSALGITIDWLERSEADAGDAFVARHPAGSVYHTSAWRRVLEEAFPHMEGRFLVLRESGHGTLLAGIPLYAVRSRILGNRLVTIPFASFCDPLVRGRADFEEMLPVAERLREQVRGSHWELRVRRMAETVPVEAFSESVPFRHHWIRLEGGEAAVWPRLSRTAVRRMVTRARNDGARVVRRDDPAALRIFHELVGRSRRRLGLPPMPESFFAAILKHLGPGMSSLHLVTSGDAVVAASLSLRYGGGFVLEYSGEADGMRQSGASQLLYWEVLREACAAGCASFSLGRTSKGNSGLLAYKDHWTSEVEDLRVYTMPVAAGRESGGGGWSSNAVLRWVFRRAPDPVVRRLGSFCYRHWG
jgi:CelD/BcsL family acetyltransferase involved in cellulose biosynthesis